MDSHLPNVAIIVIGAVGVLSALVAWLQLKKEFIPLARVKGFFLDGKGPLQSLDSDRQYITRPAEWLRDQQIALDSHAADYLLGVWGGWLAGRLPTLGELHSLSARRERARSPARGATGVAAVLLVCGVAGTLLAIHPVLDRFTIQINPDGSIQDASKSAEKVMFMIHQLGNSFFPSIWAIGFTLLIVAVRSVYHRTAFHLGRELDRFAVDCLLPAFRLPTLGEEFADTQVRLSSLADAVTRRDADFAEAVKSLAGIVKDIRAAGPELSKAAKEVAAAASRLSSDATVLVNGLTEHLGAGGALVKAISGFKESVSRNGEAAKTLAGNSKKLEETTRTLAGAVKYIPDALEKGCADAITSVADRVETAVGKAGRDMAAEVRLATAPLKESAAKVLEASSDLQANGRNARAEIATAANDGRAVLETAAARVSASADAVVTRLTNSFGVELENSITKSIANLVPASEPTDASHPQPSGQSSLTQTRRDGFHHDSLPASAVSRSRMANRLVRPANPLPSNSPDVADQFGIRDDPEATEFQSRLVHSNLTSIPSDIGDSQDSVIEAVESADSAPPGLTKPPPQLPQISPVQSRNFVSSQSPAPSSGGLPRKRPWLRRIFGRE